MHVLGFTAIWYKKRGPGYDSVLLRAKRQVRVMATRPLMPDDLAENLYFLKQVLGT